MLFRSDVPGESQPFPVAINRTDVIAGYANNGNGTETGFVRAADGTITTFDAQGSAAYAYSINAKGAITGEWFDANDVPHGFVRSAKGKIKSFDPPGAILTEPWSINDNGVIAGDFADSNGYHGFIRTP